MGNGGGDSYLSHFKNQFLLLHHLFHGCHLTIFYQLHKVNSSGIAGQVDFHGLLRRTACVRYANHIQQPSIHIKKLYLSISQLYIVHCTLYIHHAGGGVGIEGKGCFLMLCNVGSMQGKMQGYGAVAAKLTGEGLCIIS